VTKQVHNGVDPRFTMMNQVNDKQDLGFTLRLALK